MGTMSFGEGPPHVRHKGCALSSTDVKRNIISAEEQFRLELQMGKLNCCNIAISLVDIERDAHLCSRLVSPRIPRSNGAGYSIRLTLDQATKGTGDQGNRQ